MSDAVVLAGSAPDVRAPGIETVRLQPEEVFTAVRDGARDVVVSLHDPSAVTLARRLILRFPHVEVYARAPHPVELADLGLRVLPSSARDAGSEVVRAREGRELLARLHLVGRSGELRRAAHSARSVAATELTVVITGESGVGKELIARGIHAMSERSGGPFLAVNCGALAEGVLESELFGHERGAFTGAVSRRAGIFESAVGGTVLLDEVGELPHQVQVKLLRVLEAKAVTRVGSSVETPVDVRVAAATNRSLPDLVEAGAFRSDLYYRLAVTTIELPPLRSRRCDVVPLVHHFAPDPSRFDDAALVGLSAFSWPGNARQVRNVVERLSLIRPDGRITTDDVTTALDAPGEPRGDLPVHTGRSVAQAEYEVLLRAIVQLSGEVAQLRRRLDRLTGEGLEVPIPEHAWKVADRTEARDDLDLAVQERRAVEEALVRHNGNRRLAAAELGISERTLYRKIRKLDVS
jgi:transcriptional regulator with PAS, ATPase and Fis domain